MIELERKKKNGSLSAATPLLNLDHFRSLSPSLFLKQKHPRPKAPYQHRRRPPQEAGKAL
jgi:hypothetical protein